jgi:hypothetical protein
VKCVRVCECERERESVVEHVSSYGQCARVWGMLVVEHMANVCVCGVCQSDESSVVSSDTSSSEVLLPHAHTRTHTYNS